MAERRVGAAGRYRAIREKLSFVEMCMRPDVAAEVTLQPLRRFDLDAAIIFADILLPLEPMGIGFHFTPEDGPVIEKPVRTAADLEGVHTIDAASDLQYVMESLRLVRRELDGRVPLIGFSGAPFTLASYIVEGGHSRNYTHVKKLMYEDPATFDRLMTLISDVVVDYLLAQIAAGAQVVQLFDSWVGWLGPYDYEHLVLPHVRRVVEQVKGKGAPVIYFGNGASGMLHHVATRARRRHRRRLAHRHRPAPGSSSATSPCRATSTPSPCWARRAPSRSAWPTSSSASAVAPATSSTSATAWCRRRRRTTSSTSSTRCTGSAPRPCEGRRADARVVRRRHRPARLRRA